MREFKKEEDIYCDYFKAIYEFKRLIDRSEAGGVD